MQLMQIVQVLCLLIVANGAPIIARNLLGERYNRPIDGGVVFVDGHRLLGPTKTIRGIVAAVGATALMAPFVGLSCLTGALFGLYTMGGDLVTSFIKRRLGLSSSESVLGLDQGLEALCPILVFRARFALHLPEVLAIMVAFFLLEIVLSRLLYWLHIRNQPL
jgi:CDP-diglyceride synthetase